MFMKILRNAAKLTRSARRRPAGQTANCRKIARNRLKRDRPMNHSERPAPILGTDAKVDQSGISKAQSNSRLAAILNALEIAKAHRGHNNWSDRDAEALRTIVAICEKVATGSETRFSI
jgi:hypothetical protein